MGDNIINQLPLHLQLRYEEYNRIITKCKSVEHLQDMCREAMKHTLYQDYVHNKLIKEWFKNDIESK